MVGESAVTIDDLIEKDLERNARKEDLRRQIEVIEVSIERNRAKFGAIKPLVAERYERENRMVIDFMMECDKIMDELYDKLKTIKGDG